MADYNVTYDAGTMSLVLDSEQVEKALGDLKGKTPAALNMDTMTDHQLHAALQAGLDEIQNEKTVDAAAAFAQFREAHQ